MRSINDVNNDNIVGYRFHPTDQELVDHYLWNKILDLHVLVEAIQEVEGLCNKDPWDLPPYSKIKSADRVWYFFSRRKDNKRIKRTTDNGFWKVTGKTRNVRGKSGSATKKTLVFYEGRPSDAKWTPWVMQEYIFTSTVLDNKEGIFLCKLKKKDEKADTSTSEGSQPREVADDGILENTAAFDPDEMLAALEEPGNNFSPAPELWMPMLEEQLSFLEDVSYLYDFSDGHHGVLQDPSNTNELNDESWIEYLNDEVCPDERSNKQVVESEGCSLRLVETSMSCLGESSRKRSRIETGGYGAIGNEECHATRYELVVNASSMLCELAASKKIHAMPMANAPNVTLTAVEHEPHGRERTISVHNESKEMDASSVDSVVGLNSISCIALCQTPDYLFATEFLNPPYQENSIDLIEPEEVPKRVSEQEKFSGKTVPLYKAIDVKRHMSADDLSQEDIVVDSNMKLKAADDTNERTSMKMQRKGSAETDKKGFSHFSHS